MTVGYYAKLFGVQARASVVTSMQYRIDFVIEGMMSLYWLAWNVAPLLILYSARTTVAGWDFPSALVVIGWFTALRGVMEGMINPSLVAVVDKIRTGEFDYVLLKPADAQFLVSTSRMSPWRLVDMLGGVGLVIAAFAMIGRAPSAGGVLLATAMLGAAALVLYSLWILIVAACFWVVRLDNLTYLFSAVFDAARWPVHVFRGFWRVLFTLIIPLAIMTTYPAMAILGTLDARTAALAIAGATAFAVTARLLWRTAIGAYTSASS
jgi:ABC-2 type transport system permease protein